MPKNPSIIVLSFLFMPYITLNVSLYRCIFALSLAEIPNFDSQCEVINFVNNSSILLF